MAVLSSNEITKRIKNLSDEFTITPILDWKKQISDGTIDLRLDNEFIVITRTQLSDLDPIKKEKIKSKLCQYQKPVKIPYGQKFVLHPNELILGSTIEFLSFPNDLMAYVIGRSSWGRLGLIIATATQINPGFKGNLTLELVNAGNVPIDVYPGVRIAQLVIHNVSPKEISKYKEKYFIQIGPGFSKIYEDEELKYLQFPNSKTIVGLTGHKGSGKSVISSLLIEDKSYKYFSLSHIIRELYRKEKLDEPTRPKLQNFGDELRKKNNKADYLAREIIKKIQASDEISSETKIIIDGIRNPSEVKLLKKLSNFQLVAIKCSKKKLIENLRNKGYLFYEEDYKKKMIEIEKELKKTERFMKKIEEELKIKYHQENKLKLNMLNEKLIGLNELKENIISINIFEDNYNRDSGQRNQESDKEGFGQNIDACIKLANKTIETDGSVFDTLMSLKLLIKHVE